MSVQPQRFLIFNNGMIGNTLFNMPAAQWLKQTFPGCLVGMVVDRIGLELVRRDPNVDTFHTFNKKKDSLGQQCKLIMALRREKYDISLHLRKGVRNELLARLGGVRFRAGYRLKGSLQHLHVKVDEDTSVHRLTSRAQLMEAVFDRPVTLERPRLYPDAEAQAEVRQILTQSNVIPGQYMVLHPTGDSQGGITWSLETYGQAVSRLADELPVVVICMPGEKPEVEKMIPSGRRVVYYTGSIGTTAELIHTAKVFVGNDSGPAHMACAWGTPRLVVYRRDGENFTKWQPIDMTGCFIAYAGEITPKSVVEAVHDLIGMHNS